MAEFPTRGFGAAFKDHITGYCPEARGHGLRVDGAGGAILLFPGRVSARQNGESQRKPRNSAFQGSRCGQCSKASLGVSTLKVGPKNAKW